MIAESLSRLEYLCRIIPDRLAEIAETDWSAKLSPEQWSKKEILGHLIDSATNNHHRFVRAQFEDKPLITYNADHWVAASHYQTMPVPHLISVWLLYNLHIAELISRIPSNMLERECFTGDENPHTLAWLFQDYVVHLEHHLQEIVEYS